MWTYGKIAFLKIFSHFQRGGMQTMWRRGSDGRQPRLYRLKSSSGPPWRLLFFGTDHFAVESLKLLTATRCEFSPCFTEKYIHIVIHNTHQVFSTTRSETVSKVIPSEKKMEIMFLYTGRIFFIRTAMKILEILTELGECYQKPFGFRKNRHDLVFS